MNDATLCARAQPYNPSKRNAEILSVAWEHVQSVPYRVTARWLFYRLLQAGYYKGKKDYKDDFLKVFSKARKCFYGPWRPASLADDRREPIMRGHGYHTPEGWLEATTRNLACHLHRWEGQTTYAEVWFEAAAMASQFEYYTHGITLRPFGGDPSIEYKWNIAQDMERMVRVYELPIVILYFGDLDPKGESIPDSALPDIRAWCDVDFDFVRAGLNPGDERRYRIPENPEKPGTFQWEGLDDTAAAELIDTSVKRYVDYDAMQEREDLEEETTQKARAYLEGFKLSQEGPYGD